MNPFDAPPAGPAVMITTTPSDPASVTPQPAPVHPDPYSEGYDGRRRRRTAVWGAAIAAALLVAGCTAGALTRGDDSASIAGAVEGPGLLTPDPDGSAPTLIDSTTPAGSGSSGGSGAGGEQSDDTSEDALDAQDDSQGWNDGGAPQPQPQPEAPQPQGDDEPVELDPVDVPVDPCTALSGSGSLLVGPDPLVLPDDETTGTITITNCGDEAITWTALTKPSIALGDASANLLPGGSAELGFSIDLDGWDPGAIEFKVKVSEPGANHYVDVHAYDTLFGVEAAAGAGSLSAGVGVGGCGDQCITGAWLTRNATTPNPTLHVRTNTTASIAVWVSPNPPTVNGDLLTYGVAPFATSIAPTKELQTVLKPLVAGGLYHVLISATDADGDVAFFTDSFIASTPVQQPGGVKNTGGDGGCSAQCITSALVTPDSTEGTNHLNVVSHTPAQFQVYVGTTEPVEGSYGPVIEDNSFWGNSGEQFTSSWSIDLEQLEHATLHHIVVLAFDAEGRTSARTGTFMSAAAPLFETTFTLHRIEVSYDGDAGSNPGEVSFAWGFADRTSGVWGERKVNDGDVFVPTSKNTETISGHGAFLPTVYVSSAERDPDGKAEFCTGGVDAGVDPRHSDPCDMAINVASSGLRTVGSLAALPRCSDLGVVGVGPEARCEWISSTIDQGFGTEFTALISFETS